LYKDNLVDPKSLLPVNRDFDERFDRIYAEVENSHRYEYLLSGQPYDDINLLFQHRMVKAGPTPFEQTAKGQKLAKSSSKKGNGAKAKKPKAPNSSQAEDSDSDDGETSETSATAAEESNDTNSAGADQSATADDAGQAGAASSSSDSGSIMTAEEREKFLAKKGMFVCCLPEPLTLLTSRPTVAGAKKTGKTPAPYKPKDKGTSTATTTTYVFFFLVAMIRELIKP